MTAEQLAEFFHESYERLAPQFGYATRKESAKPWANVPEQNRKLMTAVCAEVLTQTAAQLAEKEREIAILQMEWDLERELLIMVAPFVPKRFTHYPDHARRIQKMLMEGLHDGRAWKPESHARYAQLEDQDMAEAKQRNQHVAVMCDGLSCEWESRAEQAEQRLQEAQAQIERLTQL